MMTALTASAHGYTATATLRSDGRYNVTIETAARFVGQGVWAPGKRLEDCSAVLSSSVEKTEDIFQALEDALEDAVADARIPEPVLDVDLNGYAPEAGSRSNDTLTWPSSLEIDAKGAVMAFYPSGDSETYTTLRECLSVHELNDEHLVVWLSDNGQEDAAERVAVLTDPEIASPVSSYDYQFPKRDGSILLIEDSGSLVEVYWSECRGVWVLVDEMGTSMGTRLIAVEGIDDDDDPEAYSFVDRYDGPGTVVATDFDYNLAFYLLDEGEEYDEGLDCGLVVWDSDEVAP